MKKVALSLAVLIFQVAVFAASEKSAIVKLDQSVTAGSSIRQQPVDTSTSRVAIGLDECIGDLP